MALLSFWIAELDNDIVMYISTHILGFPLQFPLVISLLRLGGKPCVEIQGKSGYRSPLLFPFWKQEGVIQGYGLIMYCISL